jgi:hypothetical protein
MNHLLGRLLWNDDGQDIAEYAVMLAVILVLSLAQFAWSEAMRTLCFRPRLAQFNDPAVHERGGARRHGRHHAHYVGIRDSTMTPLTDSTTPSFSL